MTRHYVVIRDEPREWTPVGVRVVRGQGVKRFEDLSRDELERDFERDKATIHALERKIQARQALLAARERGLEAMGDLDDETLDDYLREGDE